MKKKRPFFKNKKARPPQPPQASRPKSPAPTDQPVAANEIVQGVLELKGKVGFVLSTVPGVADILVEGSSLDWTMDGDLVEAHVFKVTPARRFGTITKIVERRRDRIVGILNRTVDGPCVRLDHGRWMVHLTTAVADSVKEGDAVVCRVTRWPSREAVAQGTLESVLGAPEAPTTDLPKIIAEHDLSTTFPPAVEEESNRYGHEVPDSAWKGRRTFFDQPVFTIDGVDAKDFDDAVSLERLPRGGWRLGVHIADVSHYVQEGSALDAEAFDRGTSVYFPGRVLPMLPFALSDELCSLRPNCVRLTLTCLMTLNENGDVTGSEIFESAIRSARRFTYDEVEHLLTGHSIDFLPNEIHQAVLEMGKLARSLRQKRYARGSLDFDFPEAKVIMGSDGTPLDMQKGVRLESHRLIEEFMLLANESVARWMGNLPFLYRIHETPDPGKLSNLKNSLGAFGIKIPKNLESGDPIALQSILNAIDGKPYEPLIEMLVLRSLKQAVYSPVNRGHYGLASKAYAHFTSPIRRYPDLVVHRLLRERFQNKLTPERQNRWKALLPKIGEATSHAERQAVGAEREYMDVLKVRLLEKHMGEEFNGVIVSITSFGMFVQLQEFFVEGLVHITNLDDDYYIFDEVRMSLRGRRTGRTYHMGQAVRVKMAGANLAKAQVDFELISRNDKEPKQTPKQNGPSPKVKRSGRR